MLFGFRHILIIAHAILVLAFGVQSALDMPHHADPTSVAAAEAGLGQAGQGGDDPYVSLEDSSTSQHEHETSVDHAMIGPNAVTTPSPRGGLVIVASGDDCLRSGCRATALDRPPRTVLAV